MGKKKIFNDPIYGFISFPYDIVYDLIDHPYFQRLRRIGQMGLSHYVYPGAIHTRFHHALGATHLMVKAIQTLRSKGVDISEEEARAVTIAILLHDIGHGPFSHSLEGLIVDMSHEELSLLYMQRLNKEMDGELDLAIKIFQNHYSKKYLHQLVSSQLDMDRLDYLNRDSFFTGVAEGVIGYDRIIMMLDVRDDKLVVEEKGIYSVEKYLISRWIMYWQVYLHKTSLSAEQMMIKLIDRYKTNLKERPSYLSEAMFNLFTRSREMDNEELLKWFSKIDDTDVTYLTKNLMDDNDDLINLLANGIINRRLFKVELQNKPFLESKINRVKEKIEKKYKLFDYTSEDLINVGNFTNQMYSTEHEEIIILLKNDKLIPITHIEKNIIDEERIIKYFFCYLKY